MVFIAAIFAFVGLRFFLQPDQLARTSVGRALPGIWDEAWSVCYIVGGLLLLAGVASRPWLSIGLRARLQMPALTLLTTGTAVNGGAIVVTLGIDRAMSQLPLYALALWVFDGAIRDLRDLPRERRRARPDQRGDRIERRMTIAAIPVFYFASADTGTSLLIALLGGGIVTALVQAFLYKPQRRDLEGRLSLTAVEAADIALRQAREEAGALRLEVAELRGMLRAQSGRCDALERVLIEHGIPVPSS